MILPSPAPLPCPAAHLALGAPPLRFHRDGLTLQSLLDLTDENVPAELLASIRAQGGGGGGGSDGGDGGEDEEGDDEEGEMGGAAQRAKPAAIAKVRSPPLKSLSPCATLHDCPRPQLMHPPSLLS